MDVHKQEKVTDVALAGACGEVCGYLRALPNGEQRHLFAQLYSVNPNASRSYRDAGYSSKSRQVQIRAGYRLAATEEVVNCIKWHQDQQLEKLNHRVTLKKSDAVAALGQMILLSAGEYKEEHGMRLSTRDRINAAKVVAPMLGWNEPVRVQMEFFETITETLRDAAALLKEGNMPPDEAREIMRLIGTDLKKHMGVLAPEAAKLLPAPGPEIIDISPEEKKP